MKKSIIINEKKLEIEDDVKSNAKSGKNQFKKITIKLNQ